MLSVWRCLNIGLVDLPRKSMLSWIKCEASVRSAGVICSQHNIGFVDCQDANDVKTDRVFGLHEGRAIHNDSAHFMVCAISTTYGISGLI